MHICQNEMFRLLITLEELEDFLDNLGILNWLYGLQKN